MKTEGCEHITCICGYEFCYVCGQTWYNLHMQDVHMYNHQLAIMAHPIGNQKPQAKLSPPPVVIVDTMIPFQTKY